MILLYFLPLIIQLTQASKISSYVYLNDRIIKEELPMGSFVVNLADELALNDQYKSLIANGNNNNQQYTLLEDSKTQSNSNSYFNIDSMTGQITTNTKRLDREYMCANRQCADACDPASMANCRLNLKILLLPSYNIINLNIFVEDINDNKPVFKTPNQTHQINENVPVGYRIPVDLAFDPDVGLNAIQHYELLTDTDTFSLEQNLNESSLYLVVRTPLDRETASEYELTIRANDHPEKKRNDRLGDEDSTSVLRLNIQLVDINDNNPRFEREVYKFTLREDLPTETEFGQLNAFDLDTGPNGQIRYSFVDSNVNNLPVGRSFQMKHFDLNETTGSLRLKTSLDYEQDTSFHLTVEARDMGVGSLPAYAQLEIVIVDVNDNPPDITVSFLNTLNRTSSALGEPFKYDLYLPENIKSNKFLAHVSIVDRDSDANGKFDWQVFVNDVPIDENDDSLIKIIKLNHNSFTLNVGSGGRFDREIRDHFNVSICAWDYGEPTLNKTVYNFRVRIVDLNDNAPEFERPVYDLYVYENNEPFQPVGKLVAHDADAEPANSNITYVIREKNINDYLYVDQSGNIMSKIRFDRELVDKYIFHVEAVDSGSPSLSATAVVNLNILDVNDNPPVISFNTSYYHRFHQITSRISSAYVKLGETIMPGSKLIDFHATDRDLPNGKLQFVFDLSSSSLPPANFKLTTSGQLYLMKKLDKKRQTIHELNVVCLDEALNSTIKLTLEVIEQIEYCIADFAQVSGNGKSSVETNRSLFVNRDKLNTSQQQSLFTVDYSVEKTTGKSRPQSGSGGRLFIEQLTHLDLVESHFEHLDKRDTYRLELKLLHGSSSSNRTKSLMLGKYSIRVILFDKLNPTCTRLDTFNIFVGNNFINENELITFLKSIKLTNARNGSLTQESLTSIKKFNLQFNDDFVADYYTTDPTMSPTPSGPKVYKVKEDYLNSKLSYARIRSSYLTNDFILLFILIVIIVIIALFLAFIAIICIYGRYKKQYKMSTKKSKSSNASFKNLNSLNTDEENVNLDCGSMEQCNGRLNKKAKKSLKRNMNDLNNSSSSGHSTSNSEELIIDRPQYTLVNSGTNRTYHGTSQAYKYYDDDMEGRAVMTACNGTIRQYNQAPANRYKYVQSSSSRYYYTMNGSAAANFALNKNSCKTYSSSYDAANRSNSAADSSTIETTIDDSKSNNSNNSEYTGSKLAVHDLNLMAKNTSKLCKLSKNNSVEHSSAYSSINTSDNISESDNSNKIINSDKYEDTILKHGIDAGLLSFKKHVHSSTHANGNVTASNIKPSANFNKDDFISKFDKSSNVNRVAANGAGLDFESKFQTRTSFNL